MNIIWRKGKTLIISASRQLKEDTLRLRAQLQLGLVGPESSWLACSLRAPRGHSIESSQSGQVGVGRGSAAHGALQSRAAQSVQISRRKVCDCLRELLRVNLKTFSTKCSLVNLYSASLCGVNFLFSNRFFCLSVRFVRNKMQNNMYIPDSRRIMI